MFCKVKSLRADGIIVYGYLQNNIDCAVFSPNDYPWNFKNNNHYNLYFDKNFVNVFKEWEVLIKPTKLSTLFYL